MRMVKKKKLILTATSLILFSQAALANEIQRFWGTNYTNPAETNNINWFQLLAEGITPYTHSTFTGNGGFGVGRASSAEMQPQGFLKLLTRVNPKVAIGVNISQPYGGYQSFGPYSIVGPSGYKTVTSDVDISPNVSYKATDKLSLGIGANFNQLRRLESDYNYHGRIGQQINRSSSWALGWDAGLYYALTQQTYLGLAYFSKLVPHLTGTSVSESLGITNRFKISSFVLPATWVGSAFHVFNTKWSMAAKAYYTRWSAINTVEYQNLAGVGTRGAPFGLHDSIAGYLGVYYNLTEKLSASLAGFMDGTPVGTNGRILLYPADTYYAGLVGLKYKVTKESAVQFQYGHVVLNTNLDRPFNGAYPTVGHVHLFSNVYDLTFTYNI